ncbi:MAG TPA: hypothetical protein VLB32_00775 [Candidatus Acidoferrales bacterium]|nr:hypothetical protein [Candidatus Acidoferrales bacterium]
MSRAAALVLLAVWAAVPSVLAQSPDLLAQARARRVVRPEYKQLHSLSGRQLQSDLILRGRVVDESVRLSADRETAWTDYTLEVLTVLKPASGGPAAGTRLVVPREGGNLVVDGKPVTVVNELFPSLPWVREHIFMLKKRAGGEEAYDFLDGPRSILRRDDDGRMRCILPREEWDYFCTAYNGTTWQELLLELKPKE